MPKVLVDWRYVVWRMLENPREIPTTKQGREGGNPLNLRPTESDKSAALAVDKGNRISSGELKLTELLDRG